MAEITNTTDETTEDGLVRLAKERFSQAVDAESNNRLRAVADIRFVELDEQWDAATRLEREADGRPCMVINKVQGVAKQISNDARQSKPRIKVRPNDSGASAEVAEIYNGMIRQIENASDADAAYATGIEQAIKGGWGYWRVVADYVDDDVFEQDLFVRRIVNQFSVYLDPGAKEADKSDAGWGFITEVLTRKEFEAQYPDADAVEWGQQGQGEDNVDWWVDDGIRVAEYYYKRPVTKTLWQTLTITNGVDDYDTIESGDQEVIEKDGKRFFLTEQEVAEQPQQMQPEMQQPGMPPQMPQEPQFAVTEIIKERTVQTTQLMWCKLAGGEIIDGPTEQAGKYVPIVSCVGEEAHIEGEPVYKSAFFHSKDAQRVYNWAESNLVETLALSPKQPFIGTPEMFDSHEQEWDEANRKPKMRLMANLHNGQLPQRQPLNLTDNGSQQVLVQASDDIKSTTGLFDPSLGNKSGATSGKQELILQQKGDTSTFHFKDNQRRAIAFTGRVLVDLIPHYYDTDRIVRTLGEDGAEGWVSINKRVPDPMVPGGYRTINDLSSGKYDVTCDVGPGYLTRRMEAADGLLQFLAAAPQAAPVVFPRVAKNMDWPEADEIGQELKAIMNPGQQPNPQQQQQMQMQQQMQQAAFQQQQQAGQIDLAIKQATLEGIQIDNSLKQGKGQQLQVDNQGKHVAIQGKTLDNQGKQLDNEGKQISNIGAQLDNQETKIEIQRNAFGPGV